MRHIFCLPPVLVLSNLQLRTLLTADVFLSFLLQVIYALNTKNDEHEAAIATLKEAHEEEVQQILSETREKILQVNTLLFYQL